MKKEWFILTVIAVIIAVIAISDWNKSSSAPNQTNNSNLTNNSLSKQEKEEANVTVLVEYLAAKSDDKTMTFKVSLDTHSVELDSFDFEKDIFLEAGGKISNPVKIITSGSGHHRSAEVTFEKTSPPFTIVLKNLVNINRREFLFEKLQ